MNFAIYVHSYVTSTSIEYHCYNMRPRVSLKSSENSCTYIQSCMVCSHGYGTYMYAHNMNQLLYT